MGHGEGTCGAGGSRGGLRGAKWGAEGIWGMEKGLGGLGAAEGNVQGAWVLLSGVQRGFRGCRGGCRWGWGAVEQDLEMQKGLRGCGGRLRGCRGDLGGRGNLGTHLGGDTGSPGDLGGCGKQSAPSRHEDPLHAGEGYGAHRVNAEGVSPPNFSLLTLYFFILCPCRQRLHALSSCGTGGR